MAEASGSRPVVTVGGASGREGQPAHRGKTASWLSKVFEVNPAGLNWPRAVMVLDVALVPLVIFWAIGHQEYLLSAVFGLLFAALADPGGSYGYRASHTAVFGLIGAAVTALGFGIGGDAWGWLVLAAFAVTLVAGLAAMFGVHRFVAAYLLNVWFIVALGVAASFHHHAHITSYTWAQVLAWAGGSALWIAVTFGAWLIRGREDRPQPVAELPGDTSRRKLTRPLVMFALIRAIAIAGAAALAFGLDLSHGYWLPIAAIVAMKASLDQTTLVAAQRLAGALIGAVAAALLLLIPASEHGLRLFAVERGLEVVALVVLMHGAAIRFWNYALYCGAIAAGVLILVDLPQPSSYSAEGYRVLWTLCGVGIGVLVMFLAGLLAKRTTKTQPQPAAQPR
jgi:fusaric acid resistance family protein